MIVFRNPGEIDIRGATIMGLHAKPGDSPTGFFGTGLKYAIAICLRHKVPITIYSGLTRYYFSSYPGTFRGTEQEFIRMARYNPDGPDEVQELAFTTEYGKRWELWQAYRELFANAKDENGGVSYTLDGGTPFEGFTTIVVEGTAFAACHANRSRFILETEPLAVHETAEQHVGEPETVFYRGFAVTKPNNKPLYRWNVKRSIHLTEDRTAQYEWELAAGVGNAILQSENRNLIRKVVLTPDCWEGRMDISMVNVVPGSAFMEELGNLAKICLSEINENWWALYLKHVAVKDQLEYITLSPMQKAQFNKVVLFLQKSGCDYDWQSVKFVRTFGTLCYGMVMEAQIYVALKAFESGTKQLAITLLEEFYHATMGVHDETRQFQDFLLTKVVTQMEEKNGEYL